MSRHNLCPNPHAKNNVTAWSSNGTLTQVSTGVNGMPHTTAAWWQSNGFVQTPTAACSPGDVVTSSFYLQNDSGFSADNKTIYIAFTRSVGGDDFSQTATRSFAASGSTSRVDVTGTAPANATGCYLIIDSINGSVGTGMKIGGVLVEVSSSLLFYFDGDSPNTVWDGTAGNSTSTFTPGKVETLTDDFSTQDGAKWVYAGTAGVSGGQLELVPATSYSSKIDSVQTYDLTSSNLLIQVVTAPLGNGGIDTFVKMYDSTDELVMLREGTSLFMTETVSGTPSTTSITYDSTAHAWWRIRHDGTNLLFETAPDGLTFTARRTLTPGRVWDNVFVQMLAGYFGTEPSPGISIYDNVGLPPASSGLAVTVWDGAAEVSASVTVWDGAVEQAASVTEIAP